MVQAGYKFVNIALIESFFKREGNLTKVLCGQVSFITGFKGGNRMVRMATVPKSYTQGYIYDFEEGASFEIASQATWDAKK